MEKIEIVMDKIEYLRYRATLAYCIIFFVFNVLAGVGVLAISIWLYLDTSAYLVGDHSTKFYISIYILMGVGSLMIVVGFLGCCGASQESSCMLGTFSAFVLLILAAEIGGAAYAYTHKDEVRKTIVDGIEDMVINEYGVNKGTTLAVDAMQKKLQCCGAKGINDWGKAALQKADDAETFAGKIGGALSAVNFKIPQSCCKPDRTCSGSGVLQSLLPNTDFNTQGCIDELEDKIRSHLDIVTYVGIGIAVAQILSFIFSLVLCCAVSGQSSY